MAGSHDVKKFLAVIICIVVIAAAGVLGFNYYLSKKYPLNYEDIIKEYSGKYGVDPYLVCAVIYVESGFSPNEVSHAGAMGLMQIMPETAGWIAGKIGATEFDVGDIKDPKTNIEMGCWYLGFLNGRFQDNVKLITAAYNAGHNRVSQWLTDGVITAGGGADEIPYEETKNYVEKIKTAYAAYKAKYPKAF